MKKYVVCPGPVFSKWDGDEHYVTARMLMDLYKVDPSDCVLLPAKVYEDNIKGRLRNIQNEYGDLIVLKPDYFSYDLNLCKRIQQYLD